MFQKIKDFFSKAWVQWGLSLAAVGGTLAYIFAVNDTSRPPPPDPNKSHDFSEDITKVDPEKPIGILVYNHTYGGRIDTRLGYGAKRNNLIEEMQEHYGDNIIVIDNPSTEHFKNFADQFNQSLSSSKPKVHFVTEHHTKHPLSEDTYNKQLADFITSVNADEKRALILSCGPESKIYENTGCEYVIIPRPDGEVLGPEISLEFSPAYKDAIGWMANNADPEAIRKKFSATNLDNMLHGIRDRITTIGKNIYLDEPIGPHKPAIVVVPPMNLPSQPKPAGNQPLSRQNP